ncbi:MAG TPA: cation:proton antiporter [candidate division Zixibacteria bacterium]|nr:cation:proton antiporter [candidate division Zixibacteria bacterium]
MTGGLGLTLLLALLAALVLGAIAQRLRLQPLIGFIAAGIVVGPFTPGISIDRQQVLDLSDIGVALLMFSIGLRFSVRSLAAGGPLLIALAATQVLLTIGIGYGVATLLGKPWLEALFIGAAVSNSSSVVIVKVAGEEVVQGTPWGRASVIWSTVQDLMTVALVVLLSSLAGAGPENPVLEVGAATLLAVAFIVVVVVAGSRIFPFLLGLLARYGSREIFIIGVAVLALGTAFSATVVGVSVALGAFVTGMALADSDLTDSVLGEIVPLRELFAAFFFVALGLLVDPAALGAGIGLLLVILSMVIVVKGALTALLARLGGTPPSVALRIGGLIAQNGEFSFVLAVVGLQVGAVTDDTFAVLMGVVVSSIILLAPLLRGVDWIADRLARRNDPKELEVEVAEWRLRRHAVVLGYGRVGRTVVRALMSRRFPYVAIDSDYELVRRTRDESPDVHLLYGEAGNPTMLDIAGVDQALILVVAIPDALATRQAIAYALRRNPRIEITARAPTEIEAQQLRQMGVRNVIVAEREVANELMRHTLHRFGVGEREIAAMLQRRRET